MGAGAGYTIDNYKSIKIDRVTKSNIDLSNIDLNNIDYSYDDYRGTYYLNTPINLDLEFEGHLDELSAYDYYGNGTKLEFETPCIIRYNGKSRQVLDDIVLDDSYFEEDENNNIKITDIKAFKDDIINQFIDEFEYDKYDNIYSEDYVYGGGWGHSPWNGLVVEEDYNDVHIEIYLTNQKVIDAVDYCVAESGDIKTQYINTYDGDSEPYETYEECKAAIVKQMTDDGINTENAEDYIEEDEYYYFPTIINNEGDIDYDIEFVD